MINHYSLILTPSNVEEIAVGYTAKTLEDEFNLKSLCAYLLLVALINDSQYVKFASGYIAEYMLN